jgi:hypothetical protein
MKAVARRVARAVVAAVTSTEAVKQEKNLAVLIAVRVAITLGASVSLVDFIRGIAS